ELRVGGDELFAQPLDVGVDGALADVGVLWVALGDELLAGLDAAGVTGERVEDAELRDGERQRVTLPRRLEAVEVEREVACHQNLRWGAGLLAEGAAAEEHAHARHQLAHREGLAEVVVGTELEAEHAVELLVLGGEEDDRQRLRDAADAATELEAVHARHEDVEDDEVGELLAEGVPGRLAVLPGGDLVAFAPQRQADGLTDALFVVDDGDAAAASHWVGNLPRRGGETHGRPQFEVANGVGSAAGPAGTAPVRTAAAAAARWRLAAVAGRLVAGWWTFATPAGPAAARILPIGPARLAAAPHRPRLDSLRLHTDSDQGARLDTQPPSRR